MTLATRCSACGTSFRVVQDQLKVSGGWVRCGRCNEVFNALESLYEIEAQSGQATPPPPQPQPQPLGQQAATSVSSPPPAAAVSSPAAPSTAHAASQSPPPSPARAAVRSSSALSPTEPVDTPAHADASPVPAPSPSPLGFEPLGPESGGAWVPFRDEWPQADSSQQSNLPPAIAPSPETGLHTDADGETVEPAEPSAQASRPAEWDDRPVHGFEDLETRLEPRAGDDAEPAPSFLRDKQGPAMASLGAGKRPRWTVSLVVLALLLGLQGLLAWRDTIAARLPAMERVLSLVCLPLGCRINAPRHLAAMALEGSNLRQRSGVGSGYELTVALRNRSAAPVKWPSFELTLTDSQGQALIRRVLLPQDFGIQDARLGPAAEFNLQTQLDVTDRRVAGYTVEIFYP